MKAVSVFTQFEHEGKKEAVEKQVLIFKTRSNAQRSIHVESL